jgi:hypothetical protein
MLLCNMDMDILIRFLGFRYVGRIRMNRIKMCKNTKRASVF